LLCDVTYHYIADVIVQCVRLKVLRQHLKRAFKERGKKRVYI